VHQVTVSPFWLDRIEVTVGAYRACVASGKCAAPKLASKDCSWTGGDDAKPMSCVSHEEAAAYCASVKKRLPTEAEWELAAKGTSDRRYPWGDEAPDCDKAITMKGNFTAESCGDHGPRPATRAEGRSRAGVLDMAGNLEEWVSDHYDDRYPPGDQKDPRGPDVGTAFVLRGGGWLSPRSAARVTARSWGSMQERGTNVGFRCARDASR
jgi:formylglycine-generating enzyme required for sulfatase activity